MNRRRITALVWLSDWAFQLAGGLALVAILLLALTQTGALGRGWVERAALSWFGVVAGLAASGLLLALQAQRLYHSARSELLN